MDNNVAIAKMETDIKYIKEKLDGFIASADKKYAPKWIVTILAWIAGICGAVITAGIVRYII